MMKTCSQGTPPAVAVTSDTTTGWAYAEYYSDANCGSASFIQQAGTPTDQCLLIENGGTDLVVGSMMYTCNATTADVTVHKYSGAGCSGLHTKADYKFNTGKCTTQFDDYHIQSNPFFKSSSKDPFFKSIIPKCVKGPMPAGMGLTTVEYTNFDCTGIASNFVSLKIDKPIYYNVSGGVPTVVYFTCATDIVTAYSYPVHTNMDSLDADLRVTFTTGCGNTWYNEAGVNSTSKNAVTICDVAPTAVPTALPTLKLAASSSVNAVVDGIAEVLSASSLAVKSSSLRGLATTAATLYGAAVITYQANDCNGPIISISNVIVNYCMTWYDTFTGMPSENAMFTLSGGFTADSFIVLTTWAYTATVGLQCLGTPTNVPANYNFGFGVNAINTCASYPAEVQIPAGTGGFFPAYTVYHGFKSSKIIITNSSVPISNSNLDPQKRTGYHNQAYYASSDCASSGAVQLVVQTPIGMCRVNTTQEYSAINSYREVCPSTLSPYSTSYSHNINCGVAELDITEGYDAIPNQCAHSNADHTGRSYTGNWNPYGQTMSISCSTGSVAPVPVTTNTANGWAYANYYTDSSCSSSVAQVAGNPTNQCILITSGPTDLAVGSMMYTWYDFNINIFLNLAFFILPNIFLIFSLTRSDYPPGGGNPVVTVHKYSGGGCSGKNLMADYSFTAGQCTSNFDEYHTQTNPFFPSTMSEPFFLGIMPGCSYTKPAGEGLTSVSMLHSGPTSLSGLLLFHVYIFLSSYFYLILFFFFPKKRSSTTTTIAQG